MIRIPRLRRCTLSKMIGSLSDLGWVNNPETVLNKLLGYYILTEYAQSVVFQGNLISLPYTYFQYINDPSGMAIAVKADLDKLLSRYFASVDVEVEAVAKTESIYGIVLYASVLSDDGVRVGLGRVVEMTSSGVNKIIDINNYGDGLASLR